MKLLTHNMLACHIKGVQNGFPFRIEATKVDEVDADFDPDFLRRMYPRLEWSALREGAQAMGALHAGMRSRPGMLTRQQPSLLVLHALQGPQICQRR
jgi:multifunctional methyltransferase subunit TRM112